MDSAQNTLKFIEWFQKNHQTSYAHWKKTVQAATSTLILNKQTGESDEGFQRRLKQYGAGQFQAAMWQVHDAMTKTAVWSELTESKQKLAMQASQLFLLRACRNKGLAIVSLDDVEIVDKRLRQIYKAMSSSLELEHWKFEPAIKEAIAGSDQSFARLCQAAEGLASLDSGSAANADPVHILSLFEAFTGAIITFLTDNNSEATMDAQVDVAVHTLVQLAPPALYYHVRVVELLLWEPWAAPSDAQFAMLLMSSVVIALYTINTAHFNMDFHLFLGIMASHGFNVQEFQPRDNKAGLPPPFGQGPPLGQGLKSDSTSSGAQKEPAPVIHAPPVSVAKYLGKLEKTGMAIVQAHGLPHSFAKLYPYALQEPDDLFLNDVAELLEQYKNIAIKYEALKAGLVSSAENAKR